MDKLKFFALLLLVAFGVQHVQIQQERENWRKFCIQLEADKAYAILPFALAPAAPYVLASLVAGTTAVWCYTHGGKEAWIQFTGAVNDGVDVTKAWIQEQIAQNNGIDTTATVLNWYGPESVGLGLENYDTSAMVGKHAKHGLYNRWYLLTAYVGTSSRSVDYNYIHESGGYVHIPVGPYPGGTGLLTLRFSYSGYVTTSPGDQYADGFDPADYPELYSGPALLSNCHEVAQDYPNLSLVYPPPTSTAPSSYDPTKLIEVPVVAQLADGSFVDQSGRKLPPPPPGVVPGIINPPILDPDLIGGAVIDWTPSPDLPTYVDEATAPASDVVIPKTLADLLGGLGITGVIKGIQDIAGKKAVVWTNAQGQTIATPVDAAIAAQLAPAIPPVAVQTGEGSLVSTGSGEQEQDPGSPEDPEFNLPTFDPTMDWGENTEYDVDSRVEFIEDLPIVNLVKGSTLQLQNVNSVISITLDSWPGGPTTLEVDFDQWSSIWNAMGAMIYIIAILHAISLAILGRRL